MRQKLTQNPLRILIDAGHGHPDPGVVATVGGLSEARLTRRVAVLLCEKLCAIGHEAFVCVPMRDGATMESRFRAEGDHGAQLAISIHVGSSAPGIEVWTRNAPALASAILANLPGSRLSSAADRVDLPMWACSCAIVDLGDLRDDASASIMADRAWADAVATSLYLALDGFADSLA